jgi:hypothetical protein
MAPNDHTPAPTWQEMMIWLEGLSARPKAVQSWTCAAWMDMVAMIALEKSRWAQDNTVRQYQAIANKIYTYTV